jgi:mannose-6-phosphate isomerase-like protein (cupin superfamily)
MTDEITVGADRIRFRLTSAQSGGEVAVLDVAIPPGGGPPMLHRHEPCELYRVRSGELTFYVEGDDGAIERTVAGPGTVVPIGPRLEHTVRNESGAGAEATVIFSPGEAMERFVRAAAEVGADEVLALAEAHGIEITRPLGGGGEPSAGYLTIARFSGDGDRLLATYRDSADVMAGVGRDHGLILHAAGRTDDGFLIVNVWPAQADSDAAAADPRRLRVLERTGIGPGQMTKEHYDVIVTSR